MQENDYFENKQMLYALGYSDPGWAPFGSGGRRMASNKLPPPHRNMYLLPYDKL